MRAKRERWIPQGYTTLVDEPDLAVYAGPVGLTAICYTFARTKPDWHFRFHSPEERERKIAETRGTIEAHRSRIEAERRQRRQWQTGLKVGDILHGSWGYDQTNAEFWQVVDVRASGKTVRIAPLAHKAVEGSQGFMSQMVLPQPGVFTDEPVTKRVQPGDEIAFEFYHAYPWHGKAVYSSWYA